MPLETRSNSAFPGHSLPCTVFASFIWPQVRFTPKYLTFNFGNLKTLRAQMKGVKHLSQSVLETLVDFMLTITLEARKLESSTPSFTNVNSSKVPLQFNINYEVWVLFSALVMKA
jgi:hypothetical protein